MLAEIRDALYRSNRAFVFVKNIEAHFICQKSTHAITHWRFYARWENGGNSPTKNMRNRINYALSEQAFDLGYGFPDVGDQLNAGSTMLGPKAIMHSPIIDVPVEHLQKVKTGEAHAYLWGWADYNDVFPNTARHRSEFSVKIVINGDALEENCQFSFQQVERFNGFDDECLRGPAPYSPHGYYKFLHAGDIDRVIVDGTLIVSNASYFRDLEASWGAIADPLEAASLLTVEGKFVLTEGSPELEIANNTKTHGA